MPLRSSRLKEEAYVSFSSLFADCSPWKSALIPGSEDNLQRDKLQIFHKKQTDGLAISFSAAVWFSAIPIQENQKNFNIPDWGECRIAWTMGPSTDPNGRPSWNSIDHFSMMLYGWIPDDGFDLFTQFILYLKKERWLKICDLAEEHLAKCVSRLKLMQSLDILINFL